MKIDELTPRSKRVDLTFKVLEKEEVKNVRSKKDRTPHAVSEALVGDDTGTLLLTLWDEDIEKIQMGKTYKVSNGYITMFKGTMRFNIGRYGGVEESAESIEANTKNNVSEKVYDEFQRPRGYRGLGTDSYWPG